MTEWEKIARVLSVSGVVIVITLLLLGWSSSNIESGCMTINPEYNDEWTSYGSLSENGRACQVYVTDGRTYLFVTDAVGTCTYSAYADGTGTAYSVDIDPQATTKCRLWAIKYVPGFVDSGLVR